MINQEEYMKSRLDRIKPYLEMMRRGSPYYTHVLLHKEEIDAIIYAIDYIMVEAEQGC